MDEGTEQTSAAVEQPVVERPITDNSTAGEKQDTATTAEVSELYKDLGIDAPVPTGKTKGRPKSATVRAKDAKTDGDKDTEPGRQEKAQGKSEQKDASAPDKDGDSGDDTDPKGKKVGKDSGEVSDEPDEADKGVREDKPETEEDTEQGSADDAEERDEPAGKRPGKSNPEVEKRFQKLTSEIREREERIEELSRQLQESTKQYQEHQVAAEDPEYTVEDFRKVRDENGEVFELDEDQAELAFRRWQDGYTQRASEREAAYQYQQQQEQVQHQTTQRLMESSAQAYDTLTGIMDEYSELNPDSPNFDEELSNDITPVIQDMIIYQPGTEPGNEEGYQPVIVGLKMNPTKILGVINKVKTAKRNLPLNGINDTVDTGSHVSVQRGRSSDSMVNAANDLYKELGIEKRI